MNNMGGLKVSRPRMLVNHFKDKKLHFNYIFFRTTEHEVLCWCQQGLVPTVVFRASSYNLESAGNMFIALILGLWEVYSKIYIQFVAAVLY